MNKLNKAKATLILDHPFFASLLLSLKLTERNDIKTFATDGASIFYNKDFAESLSLQEIVFVLAHEVLHIAFLHAFRRGKRDHNRFNQAADYIINQILVDDKVGKMPDGGLLNKSLYDQGKTAEGIYDLLPAEQNNIKTGDDGGALDDLLDSPLDEAQAKEKQADIQVKLIQAKNAAKAAGKLSRGVASLVDSLTKNDVNWSQILRNFFTSKAKIDLTFARPNRRFLGEDFILPSLSGENIGKIAIAVDCSGSIDLVLKKQFESELKAIFEDLRPAEIIVVYFDTEVLKVDSFTDAQDFKINRIDGGGTGFGCVFKELSKTQDLIGCVVFTDLDSEDFGQAPDCPLLWASYGLQNAPFGEIIKIKRKDQ